MIQSGRSKDSEREAQLKLLEKDKALLEVVFLVDEKEGGGGKWCWARTREREIRPPPRVYYCMYRLLLLL